MRSRSRKGIASRKRGIAKARKGTCGKPQSVDFLPTAAGRGTREPSRDWPDSTRPLLVPVYFRVFTLSRFRDCIFRNVRLVPACLCALSLASCGPHMIGQQSLKPYKQEMPAMAPGTVPTAGSLATLTLRESKLSKNPVPASKLNLTNGRIFYGYYCLQCHGENGDGNGPVGQSYVPKPADLSSAAIAHLPDGQVYYRMLHGIGHDPVMDQTVPPRQRWPLVLYVRTFAKRSAR